MLIKIRSDNEILNELEIECSKREEGNVFLSSYVKYNQKMAKIKSPNGF